MFEGGARIQRPWPRVPATFGLWIAVSLLLPVCLPGHGDAAAQEGRAVDAPARALSERGLSNLVDFARLFGYVRHFHPSDECVRADWSRLARAGVEAVEGAENDEDLANRLSAFFGPLAPSVRIRVETAQEAEPRELQIPPGATRWVAWRHLGYGQEDEGGGEGPYSSRVVRARLDQKEDHEGSQPGTAVVLSLSGGVGALVPIGVYADGQRTLPPGERSLPAPPYPKGWIPSGDDRTTRLAAVILAWNTLQHFYPYFDVVQTDWPGALRASLERAALDSSREDFHITLEYLVAALHDGHGAVTGPGPASAYLALRWTWVGEELVVTQVTGDFLAVRPGDVVEAMDEVPTAEVFAAVSGRISSATEQWSRWRAAQEMGAAESTVPARLTVRHRDGSRETAMVPRTRKALDPDPARSENGAELLPGVVYFDLSFAETEALDRLLPRLATASGVVFDLRGYPGSAGKALLQYLCDGPVQSARWNVPILTLPDRQGVTYSASNWNITPEEPRIGGTVVFVTDGRAISAAESCLGIVEHYHLGEIVGGPTAGTNGNVVHVRLPGGYEISFTGMQVTKQDGTPHHGVGIRPTVAVSPTVQGIAEGRDELLERAVRVASGE